MKLFVVALCVAVCSAAKLDNTYLPPGSARTAGGSGSFLSAPRGGSGFGGGSSFGGKTTFGGGSSFGSKHSFSSGSFGKTSGFGGAAAAAPAQAYGAPGGGNYRAGGGQSAGPQIPIVRFNNDNNGDGNYRFEYETGNGIQAQEAGQQKSGGQEDINEVQGSFAYTGDDGQQYSISYVADENGFQPQGAHLPTPPPIPEEILKSLQENAADEARGIVDDGNYNAGAHGGAGSYGGSGSHGGAGSHGSAGSHGGAGAHGGYGSSNRGNSGSFGGGSSFGGSFGGKTSGGFGNAGANKQYLAPRKPSFNSNTGYNY